jgi:sugar lactone lactonase YvrE
MKKMILCLSAVLLATAGFSQAYNSPESIEFDYANNRWFIANNGGNNILARNSSNGVRTVFATGFSAGGPHGLEIVNDTLYVCAGANLKAFNINSPGTLLFNIPLGATFLNGITHDNTGNLYITDYSGNKIYRFNTNTRQFNVFVSSGISSPNGIIFDQPNNRCVFVQWAGAIRAVSLSDSTVTTLVTSASSGLNQVDGITKDGAGNYFVSSWSPIRITRYTNTFTSPANVVSAGLSNPADIFYNVVTDTLGVPNSGSGNNTTYHYFGSATGISEAVAAGKLSLSVNPNPIIKAAEINYDLPENSKVLIELFDIKGTLMKTIVNEDQIKGKQTTFFSKSGLAAGTYLLKIETDSYLETKRIMIAE